MVNNIYKTPSFFGFFMAVNSKTARFAFPNGPFRSAVCAVLQSRTGRFTTVFAANEGRFVNTFHAHLPRLWRKSRSYSMLWMLTRGSSICGPVLTDFPFCCSREPCCKLFSLHGSSLIMHCNVLRVLFIMLYRQYVYVLYCL